MKYHILLLFTVLMIGLKSNAQEGIPVYFDYLSDNYYLVFPSMVQFFLMMQMVTIHKLD